jgi:uncharacterized protein (UPF0210 family)
VKIRAVTLGADLPTPEVRSAPFAAAARFLAEASARFAAAGIPVQMTRMAGPDLTATLRARGEAGLSTWARETEAAALAAGIDYLSFGRLPAAAHEVVATQVAPILAGGAAGFVSADLIDGRVASVPMARACARAVKTLAETTPSGFGNLRFAATANCPGSIPFLPAAYHRGGAPWFALAVQAADVVVEALTGPGTLAEIESRLVEALESAVRPAEEIALELSATSGYAFAGVDLSPAPFPSATESIGAGIEAAGADRVGAPGALFVAALITRAIRRTRVRRCGFSGLMLPVLEDAVLARRVAELPPTVPELLLYSAVCGTGLDTIPVPGSVTESALAGIFLDVAALSIALQDKPLTARLLPVPGAAAGDWTSYEFEYFVNTRVMGVPAGSPDLLLARDA